MSRVTPTTAEEVADALRTATGERRHVTTTGSGTRSRTGRPTAPGTIMSRAGLSKVIEHSAAELTVRLVLLLSDT